MFCSTRVINVKNKKIKFCEPYNKDIWCEICMQVMLLKSMSNNNQYYKIIMTSNFPHNYQVNSDEYKRCLAQHPLHHLSYISYNSYLVKLTEHTHAIMQSLLYTTSHGDNCVYNAKLIVELFELAEK